MDTELPVKGAPIEDKALTSDPNTTKTTAAKPVAEPIAQPVDEPVKVQPVAEPVKTQPVAAKPVAEPVKTQPVAAKPVAEPVKAQPVAAKPVAEPVKAQPVAAKPVTAVPVTAKPVTTAPVASSASPAVDPVSGDEVVASIAASIAARGFKQGLKNPAITTAQITSVLATPQFSGTVSAKTLADARAFLANEKATATLIANAKSVAVHMLRAKLNATQAASKAAAPTPKPTPAPVAEKPEPVVEHAPVVHPAPVEPHLVTPGGKRGPALV